LLNIFSRHRPLALLASVVLAQVLLLAFQIRRGHDVRLIRYWAVEVMTPAERGGSWGFSTIHGMWTGYVDLRNARRENRDLRDQLGRLQLRNRELESEAQELVRLKGLQSFRDAHTEAQMMAAQVIGASADGTSHTLFINRGARDGVRPNMAVVTPDGVVGKVVEAFPNTSQVLLINDKQSGVGALFSETRTHGVVKGSGDPQPRMDYVVNDEKVKPGEIILTSGDDKIFPKGLLIGTVTDTKEALPFRMIHVQPAARLDRLEDVLVLLTQQPLEPKIYGETSPTLVPTPPPPPAPIGPATPGTPAATAAASGSPAQASSSASVATANATKPSSSSPAAPPQTTPAAAKPSASEKPSTPRPQ
jgi:rod shape-determining protein MreC